MKIRDNSHTLQKIPGVRISDRISGYNQIRLLYYKTVLRLLEPSTSRLSFPDAFPAMRIGLLGPNVRFPRDNEGAASGRTSRFVCAKSAPDYLWGPIIIDYANEARNVAHVISFLLSLASTAGDNEKFVRPSATDRRRSRDDRSPYSASP